MDSETLGDSCDDIIAKARGRWTEKSIVYTRRNRKKARKTSNEGNTSTPTATTFTPENPPPAVVTASTDSVPARTEISATVASDAAALSPPHTAVLTLSQDSEQALVKKKKANRSDLGSRHKPEQPQHRSLDTNEDSLIRIPELPNNEVLPLPNAIEAENFEKLISDGNGDLGSPQIPLVEVNGVKKSLVISNVDDRIRFNLSKATVKEDIKDFRRKLLSELDQVSSLIKDIEARELMVAPCNNIVSSNYVAANVAGTSAYSHPQPKQPRHEVPDRRLLVRVNSEIAQLRHPGQRLSRVNSNMGTARSIEMRPYSRQLSVAVMENMNRGNEFVEKEKRTPKANQFYRNSEFLLGKDRLPPENKRLRTNNIRKHGGENEHCFGFEKNWNRVFKNCSSLLQRLMKHKHGWVFNEPVDVKGMGLVDYHDIIKHPMDLGTIKFRLSQNWYKSPRDFAEDVRLVFRNAMTYNPKGQDVHFMAEELSHVFEERWAVIEAECSSTWKYPLHRDGLVSRNEPLQNHYGPGPYMRAFDSPQPASAPIALDRKARRPHIGRTPLPKKPKAKDPNKRDMTYEEKQKLSNQLQGLPSEKLDAIVQIIKKRNTAVSQHDDEIEVDIDSVDAETLWDLDRFVTNYKKSLSKHKRKAELALQASAATDQNAVLTNPVPAIVDQIESESAVEKSTIPRADSGNRLNNGSKSSSSSSSSSDSGSSSSDSDSDSSSADGSDAGRSPKS